LSRARETTPVAELEQLAETVERERCLLGGYSLTRCTSRLPSSSCRSAIYDVVSIHNPESGDSKMPDAE